MKIRNLLLVVGSILTALLMVVLLVVFLLQGSIVREREAPLGPEIKVCQEFPKEIWFSMKESNPCVSKEVPEETQSPEAAEEAEPRFAEEDAVARVATNPEPESVTETVLAGVSGSRELLKSNNTVAALAESADTTANMEIEAILLINSR